MIVVTDSIRLSENEIEEQFIRAPGPGGQNVNKVATAVQLRFDAANSPALSEDVFRRLAIIAGRRMTGDGVIVLTAKRHRSQARNREEALERLIAMIRAAAMPPRKRIATKPPAASRRKATDAKKRRGAVKKQRRTPPTDEI